MAYKRYFTSAPDGEAKVGELSKELRKALSLEDDMLPIWTYRMRVLGYPPVWMGEAEVKKSLSIFDGQANNSIEEGEVNDGGEFEGKKYNKEAFHKYPGFNCPVPPGVKDDWLLLSMPPMMDNQQLVKAVNKSNCVEHVPYKKRKLDASYDNVKELSRSCSPSSTPASPDLPLISQVESSTSIASLSNEIGNGNEKVVEMISESSDAKLESQLDSTGRTVEKEEVVGRKLNMIAMGTPVPKIRKTLPGLEKWAVGMGDLLYFENLPTSVGAYNSKIKGLIGKIREIQKHNETTDENKKEGDIESTSVSKIG